MPDRQPEAWESSAPGPFLRIEGVAVWALGEDRYRITAPEHEQLVVGFDEARQRAHELAEQL